MSTFTDSYAIRAHHDTMDEIDAIAPKRETVQGEVFLPAQSARQPGPSRCSAGCCCAPTRWPAGR